MSIPLGTQRAKAVSWALGQANTGTPQVGVEFELLDADGRPHITWYGFFTDKTLERTVESLRHMGWEGCDLDQLDGLDRNEVYLVIDEQPDLEGKMRARVRWVNSSGGLAMTNRLEGNDLRAFSAQMRSAILALDPSNAAKHAAARKPSQARKPAPSSARSDSSRGPMSPEPPPDFGPPPHDDSDIPF